MRHPTFSLLGPVVLWCVGIGCGETKRVTAQAESDQPFSIPGVEGDVCLARIVMHGRLRQRASSNRKYQSLKTIRTAIAAEGTRISANGTHYTVSEDRDSERAVYRSKGWEPVDFRYEWSRKDDDRAAPPDALVRLAMQSGAIRSVVLLAVCDGNADCSGKTWRHDLWDLDNLQVYDLEVIRCGQSFEYAAPDAQD
ncbi:MAG: hypothetical protein R6X02_12720 [Enhygromyxa sp.]